MRNKEILQIAQVPQIFFQITAYEYTYYSGGNGISQILSRPESRVRLESKPIPTEKRVCKKKYSAFKIKKKEQLNTWLLI